MKIGLYYCHCGIDDMGNAAGSLDVDELERRLVGCNDIAYMRRVDYVCSEDGRAFLQADLEENRPDRVVMTVCSVRDHEEMFRGVMEAAGLNPWYLQLVNVREHVAWVTEGSLPATEKAIVYLKAAARRVQLHEPLQKHEIDMCTDTLVIGAGPAGLKAALTLSEGGRKVILVEKSPIIGGLPVRFEELFPRMECGPCMLEPIVSNALQGNLAENIELMLTSEVAEVSGFFGNFEVKIRRRPRHVSVQNCVGCGMCSEACPVSVPNPLNLGRTERKAIDLDFLGGLPNVPHVVASACLHLRGEDCTACRDVCPVEDTVLLDQVEEVVERRVGAIIVTVGGALYDCSRIPGLGLGVVPDVCDSFAFERIMASSGPTGGSLVTREGKEATAVAIVHCAGSLDAAHVPYCSGICCLNAFKFNHLVTKKAPGTKITHLYKTIVAPGKEEYASYTHCLEHPDTEFIQYRDIDGIRVRLGEDGRKVLTCRGSDGNEVKRIVDLVVLMAAVVPAAGTVDLAGVLDVPVDPTGFFEESHGRTDAARSAVRGVYLAGMCQGPKDIQGAMTQGMAAAGYVLSGLVPGRKLSISPMVATIDESRCSGCQTCIGVCPYRAITFEPREDAARVNPVLCVGCGTCVAACPAGVIQGHHFTNDEIFAEIEELLK